MRKQTVDLIIKVAIEVAEWLAIILKEKRRQKKNETKRDSEKKSKR